MSSVTRFTLSLNLTIDSYNEGVPPIVLADSDHSCLQRCNMEWRTHYSAPSTFLFLEPPQSSVMTQLGLAQAPRGDLAGRPANYSEPRTVITATNEATFL
jgi:hypothetical protein